MEDSIITVPDGPFKGIQIIVRSIQFLPRSSGGGDISCQYDLVSELTKGQADDFDAWFKPFMGEFLEYAREQYEKENS